MFYQPYSGGQGGVMPMMIHPEQHPARFLAPSSPRRSRPRQSYYRSDPQPPPPQESNTKLSFRIDKKGRSKHNHRRAPSYSSSVNEIPLPVRLAGNGIVMPRDCWNCGGSHTLNQCSFNRSNECIRLNRTWHQRMDGAKSHKKSLSTVRLARNTRGRRKYSNKRYFVAQKISSSSSKQVSSATDSAPEQRRLRLPEPTTPSSQSSRDELQNQENREEHKHDERSRSDREASSEARRNKSESREQNGHASDEHSRSAGQSDVSAHNRGRWKENERSRNSRERSQPNRKRHREQEADQPPRRDDRKRRSRTTSEQPYRQPRHRPPPMTRSLPPRDAHYAPYAERPRHDKHGYGRNEYRPAYYQSSTVYEHSRSHRNDYGGRSAPYVMYPREDRQLYGRRDRNYHPRRGSPPPPPPPPRSYQSQYSTYPVYDRRPPPSGYYSSRRY